MDMDGKRSRRLRIAIVFMMAYVGAAACVLFGQQETAQQVMKRSDQAYGEQWTKGKISDWAATGKIWINGRGKNLFDFNLMVKSNEKVKRTVHLANGRDIISGYDGKNSWHKTDFIATNAANAETYFIDSLTKRSIAGLFDKNNSLKDLGVADKRRAPESEASRVIEARNEKGQATRYYVDNNTSLVKRVEFDTGAIYTTLFNDAHKPAYASFVYSDYRRVDGFIIPFKIEVYQGLVKIEELTFTSVQINSGIKDDQFVP